MLRQVRGSTLVATLAAVLFSWCALDASSGHYGLHATFDGEQFELRLVLPAFCVRISAVTVDGTTDFRSVSLCTLCRGPQERSLS
ncbi:MAG TPA: hypothetical protein VKB41_01945 [Steroidobacteraceae bacterium]|jgi:hypothetical protein|nr:hypothetical protein [Steroidobacteraceae bacterium]